MFIRGTTTTDTVVDTDWTRFERCATASVHGWRKSRVETQFVTVSQQTNSARRTGSVGFGDDVPTMQINMQIRSVAKKIDLVFRW